ncbi:hypothetical protein PYW08_011718 [Mythimna loreyi]|uniref:Uncharacterized protein n=1 Tax=Mythimna loreyi TaxID=667449 RepID=A0ACC2QL87_9NEOP|nr:hypothetical protein PYW08_011718 [Mythimna loreyi]
MWFVFNKYKLLFVIVLTTTYDISTSDEISTTNFNAHLRDYSAVAEINNITNVKTLQKEDIGKYATFTPASNPIKFKEIPDSALSSSSNGRGLYHDQPGYAINDYDEGPHYTHGHDYHLYDHHPDFHGPPAFEHDVHHSYPHGDHHDFHDPHGHRNHLPSHGHHYQTQHHSEYGTFNKQYKHAFYSS